MSGVNRDRTNLERANRRAAVRWGSLVVGLLTLQVALGGVAIFLATSDRSVAVVPNYHEKALHWDEAVAARAASQRLGWTASIQTLRSARDGGDLQIGLTGRSGEPVAIESGTVEIYRHARGSDVIRVPLKSVSSGTIHIPRCIDAEGLWQVSLDVRDGAGNRFVESREIDVEWNRSSDMELP